MSNISSLIINLDNRLGEAAKTRFPDEGQRYTALQQYIESAISSLFTEYTAESLPSNYEQLVLTQANILFLYSVASSSIFMVDMTSPEGSMKSSQIVENALKLIKEMEKQLNDDLDDIGLLEKNKIHTMQRVKRDIYWGDVPINTIPLDIEGEFILSGEYDSVEGCVNLSWTKDVVSKRFVAYHLIHNDSADILNPSTSVSGIHGISKTSRKIWSSISRNTSGTQVKSNLVTGNNYYMIVVEQGTGAFNFSNIVGVNVT